MPTIQKDSNYFSRSTLLPCTCATRLWYLSVNERADLSEKSPSSCFTVGWRCALPREQTGRLAQSPHAATVETLDPPSGRGHRSLSPGWHPQEVTPSRPSQYPGLVLIQPEAHMGHRQQGFIVRGRMKCIMDGAFRGLKGWSAGGPAAEPPCLHLNTFRPEWLQSAEKRDLVFPRDPRRRGRQKGNVSAAGVLTT